MDEKTMNETNMKYQPLDANLFQLCFISSRHDVTVEEEFLWMKTMGANHKHYDF